jgi:hypothetical protein
VVAVFVDELLVLQLCEPFDEVDAFDFPLPFPFEHPHEHDAAALVSGVTSRDACSWYSSVMHHFCRVPAQFGEGL